MPARCARVDASDPWQLDQRTMARKQTQHVKTRSSTKPMLSAPAELRTPVDAQMGSSSARCRGDSEADAFSCRITQRSWPRRAFSMRYCPLAYERIPCLLIRKFETAILSTATGHHITRGLRIPSEEIRSRTAPVPVSRGKLNVTPYYTRPGA